MYNTIILHSNIDKVIEDLNVHFENLVESGNLFCLVINEYDENGNVVRDFLDVAKAADQKGYKYINTIICINPDGTNASFCDNIYYLLWFGKNLSKLAFSKDSIRESHIWEKVEWGKRAKNYNPKGKDPGNVWIPTIDDGKAHITNHILLSKADIINRILSTTLFSPSESAFLLSYDAELVSSISDNRVVSEICNVPPQPSPRNTTATIPSSNNHLGSQVFFGSSENMSVVPSSSIDVVVTSPPYWDLKDYFKEGQIGQESYEVYLSRMETVYKECHSVLKDTGSLWININIRRQNGKLILIPWDIIRICKGLGFFYKGIIIWHKSSGIPTGDKNLVDHHEYVLVFSKSQKLHINTEIMSSYSDYKNSQMNGGAIWNINRKAGSVGKKFIHPAIYPNGLVQRIIQVTTHPKQIALDPFLGSGTTLIAAELIDRRAIGFEFNEGFKDLIESRISTELGATFSVPFTTCK